MSFYIIPHKDVEYLLCEMQRREILRLKGRQLEVQLKKPGE
jgi:hypothetical protein